MMAWETEDEYCSPTVPAGLPTPAHSDVPSRKNSRASRRAARRSVTPPGRKSSSPPIPDKSKRSSKDITTDETISILDPRRFTPTLHANLVSEILTLRRDQEEKIKLIEQLESALHASRQEQEVLEQTVVNTSKETRAVKRQLSLLEGGTSTAIGDLAKERDEAVETSAETKKKLETAQRKIKAQEEDSQRVHNQWAKEKNEWEEERRKFERKIHISESRLKIILDEVAAYQAQQQSQAAQGSNSDIDDGTDRENDSASIRSQRPASVSNSVRFSIISNRGLNSLADELDFGGDDEWIEYDDRRESLISINNAFRHSRTFSKDSTLSLTKGHARTQSIQSIDSLRRPSSGARGTLLQSTPVIEAPEDDISVNGTITGGDEDLDVLDIDESMADVTVLERPMTPPSEISIEYVDTGVQFSPPSSPKLEAIMGDVISIPAVAIKMKMTRASVVFSRSDAEIEANQRRKRVHIGPPLTIEPVSVVSRPMISSGSQTIEAPLSPPKTPVSPVSPVEIISIPPTPIVRVSRPFKPTMVTSYTQTEPIPQRRIKTVPQQVSVAPLPIPSISIVPPSSRPSSPHEYRLPQHFKDFGCQVNMPPPQMVTSSVQTEPIRIDKRLAQLPPHLRPSAIRSRPTTPDEGSTDDPRNFTPIPGYLPPRNPRRLASQRSISDVNSSPPAILLPSEMPVDAYPGNNDDGPLSGERAPMRRPHRISSLFAGFDGVSSDDGEEYLDADSDNEYRTVLSAPKPKMGNTRPTKRGSTNAMSTSPEMLRRGSSRSSARTDMFPTYTLTENVEVNGPIRRPSVRGKMFEKGGKAAGMRKAAIIQSGIVTHSTRPRSPSLPDGRDPPFPIPTRASSRRPPASASAPSDGSHSPSRRGSNRSHYRNNSIRKVRSAAALPRGGRIRRGGSRSPPPLSMSPMDPPTSPSLPPLPSSDLTSPQGRSYRTSSQYRRHRSQLSTTTANTALTANTANTGLTDVQSVTSQTTGVVDAIAQTMIGEWMFKYVRRRKSFGVPESSNREEPSNDRHKRWVWLAPYERAILWSSKQPSSNSILMGGKAGRKLLIQSVLDVKDDNPAPKGATQLFNRSILILTPQRALKFTATSAERHYLWLTALSFLAHSSQAIPENLVPPNPDLVSFEIPPPVKTRRPGIRDSIRLTKSRHGMSNNFKATAPPSIPSIPSLPSAPSLSPIGDVMAFQARGSFSTQPSSNQSQHTRDQSRDAAEPPFIPRFSERAMHQGSLHGRKRSNTGGHVPPPLSFRGFSGPAGSSSYHAPSGSVAGTSINTAGSSDAYQQSSSGNTWAGSQRTSEASSRPSNNFFDAIGTVRMEAFISPLAYSQFDDDPDENDEFRASARRRSKEMRRRNSRSRNRDSYNSRWSGSRTGGEEDFFSRDDPFKGF